MKTFEDFLREMTDVEKEETSCGCLFRTAERNFHFRFIEKGAEEFLSKEESLVTVWEDQWNLQKEVIVSRIKSLLGNTRRIHGRDTKVESISAEELKVFLAEHHLNDALNTRYKLGLRHKKGELVAVAAFGPIKEMSREKDRGTSGELIRYCSLCECTVVGGMSKLIKAFMKEHRPGDLMTYVDREWSTGENYEQLGFRRVGETKPLTFYVNRDTWQRATTPSGTPHEFLIRNQGNYKYILDYDRLFGA